MIHELAVGTPLIIYDAVVIFRDITGVRSRNPLELARALEERYQKAEPEPENPYIRCGYQEVIVQVSLAGAPLTNWSLTPNPDNPVTWERLGNPPLEEAHPFGALATDYPRVSLPPHRGEDFAQFFSYLGQGGVTGLIQIGQAGYGSFRRNKYVALELQPGHKILAQGTLGYYCDRSQGDTYALLLHWEGKGVEDEVWGRP